MRFLLIGALFLSLAPVFPSEALAQPRGVVLHFTGPRGGAARNAIVRRLRGDADLVPRSDVEARAERRRQRLTTDSGRRRIARDMNLDFFIAGRVRGRGRRARTSLVIYGSNGEVISRGRAPRPVGRSRLRQIGNAARRMLLRATGGGGSDDDDDYDDEDDYDDDDDDYRDDDDDDDDYRDDDDDDDYRDDDDDDDYRDDDDDDDYRDDDDDDDYRDDDDDDYRDDDDDDDDDDDERYGDYDDDDDDDGPSEFRPGNLPIFVGRIGLLGRSRSASLDALDAGGTPSTIRDYNAPFFPAVSLHIHSYPLRGQDSAAKGLYLQIDFDLAFALSTQERTLNGELGEPIDTGSIRFLGQAGFLYGISEDAVRLGPMIGYGIDSFSIERNTTLVSTSYNYLRVGIAGDLRVYEDLVRLRVDIGYRIAFGAGEVVPAFGETSSQGGFDLSLELGGFAANGLAFALRAGLNRYGVTFTGEAMSDHPASITAQSLGDLNLHVGVEVGYAL